MHCSICNSSTMSLYKKTAVVFYKCKNCSGIFIDKNSYAENPTLQYEQDATSKTDYYSLLPG